MLPVPRPGLSPDPTGLSRVPIVIGRPHPKSKAPSAQSCALGDDAETMMARTLITGRAQTVTTEDFNERVRILMVGKLDPVKGRIYQKNFKTGFSGAMVK
jgi:hypothetical protein